MPKLNPPPGWPPVPAGWTPPANWQPDPAWPAPPPGWQLWIEDNAAMGTAPVATATRAPAAVAAPSPNNFYVAVVGGLAIVIGAWLPFISVSVNTSIGSASSGDFTMPVFLEVTSAMFGLLLTGFAWGMRKTVGFGTALMVLSILGLCGYVGFTMLGIGGISIFHFSPGIGLIFSILGCIAVLVGASRTKKTIA